MKHFISLAFSIIFLFFLNACGGGSSSNDDDTSPADNLPPVADAGEDKIVFLDQIVTITGSGSDADGTVVSYVWKEGSTVLSDTATFDYTATTEGIHTLTLTVTDNEGATDSDTIDVNATSVDTNLPPVADAGEDKIVFLDQIVTITGSGSDADGTVVSYVWKEGSTVLSDTATFDYTATTEGIHTLTLTVTDNEGATDSDTIDVNATSVDTNLPPVADAGEDKIVFLDQIVTITGSGSDADGTVVSYVWKEGSTVLSDTATFDYTATTEGIHTLTLTVTDNEGATDSDTIDVNATSFPDAVAPDPLFESLYFSGSQNCATCHNSQTDSITGEDVSIVNAWQSTMMANAAIDPLYLAKVASEVKRNPDFKEVIEAKCSRCHMPMANVEANIAGDPIAMSGDGFLNPSNPYYDMAREGVSCTLCHQIENDPKLGTEAGFSGEFVIDEITAKPNRKIYGEYNDMRQGQVDRMQSGVDFIPTYGSHIEDSKLCASCHNLNTPVIAADGKLTDPLVFFPEQAVYTEWEYSDFNNSNVITAKRCQDCHMPKSSNGVIIATGGNLQPRTPFHQHQFIGANTYMLEIIKNNRTKLGVPTETKTANFDTTITNTREFLKAAADVKITDVSFENDTLDFSVLVSNHSGHRFPTSLPSRRAWLHVKVTNAANQTVFESGAFNGNGQIIGVDDNTDGYEEHHDEIDDAAEVQVYEPIMANTDGNLTYTFMQASQYIKDNRILPLGYKANTPANAQPYGDATDDDDFVGGSDTVDYEVSDIPEANYNIVVTLRYQTMSYGFAQDLYKDMDLTDVALMKSLDDTTTNHFEDISTDTAAITLP